MLVLTAYPNMELEITVQDSDGTPYVATITVDPSGGKRARLYIDAPQKFQFIRKGDHGANTDKEGRKLR